MAESSITSGSDSVDLTGRQLGDYRLLRRLGRGGMADVYLAQQSSLQRKVALKILKPELARDDSYVRRFEREAQAAAALVQSNIVQIYEVGHVEGFHFIAQEYVRGRNLKQYIDRNGAVEPVMAINVLRQSAMALQKANELGVIHRDIKPENIMLSTSGEVKVTDFGLARINSRPNQQALTQIGITMGTPLYMSPEQVGASVVDHRSDIYSLGVTAYHMLAGEPPFNADNPLAIAVQHVNDEAPSLKGIRPDLPGELVAVIEKMMRKKAAERQRDARELLKELRAVSIDADADWELIVERLAINESDPGAESFSFSQSQLAATRQLQQMMKGHSRIWWRSRKFWASLVVVALFGMVAGFLAARRTQPDPLLNLGDIERQTIPRKASVEQQYEAARWRPREEQEQFFEKVIEYFPLDPNNSANNLVRLYHRRSKARLAELYLTEERWNEAEAYFNEFTTYDEMAEEFRVMGFAGLAYISFRRGPTEFVGGNEERQELIRQAVGEVVQKEGLLNRFMRTRFDEVVNSIDMQQESGQSFPDLSN